MLSASTAAASRQHARHVFTRGGTSGSGTRSGAIRGIAAAAVATATAAPPSFARRAAAGVFVGVGRNLGRGGCFPVGAAGGAWSARVITCTPTQRRRAFASSSSSKAGGDDAAEHAGGGGGDGGGDGRGPERSDRSSGPGAADTFPASASSRPTSTSIPLVIALTATVTLALSALYQSLGPSSSSWVAHAEASSSEAGAEGKRSLSVADAGSSELSPRRARAAGKGAQDEEEEEAPTSGYGDASLGVSHDVLDREQSKGDKLAAASGGGGGARYADAETRGEAIERLKRVLGEGKVSVAEEDRVGHGMAGESAPRNDDELKPPQWEKIRIVELGKQGG